MRKFLQVLGALFLVLLCAAIIGFGIAGFRSHALDEESKSFVDKALPAIIFTWNEQQLVDRASPDFKAHTTAAQLSGFFDTLATLGPLITCDGAKGDATWSYTTQNGNQISASYTAHARFQNGSATFHVFLVKLHNSWEIEGFHVDPVLASGS